MNRNRARVTNGGPVGNGRRKIIDTLEVGDALGQMGHAEVITKSKEAVKAAVKIAAELGTLNNTIWSKENDKDVVSAELLKVFEKRSLGSQFNASTMNRIAINFPKSMSDLVSSINAVGNTNCCGSHDGFAILRIQDKQGSSGMPFAEPNSEGMYVVGDEGKFSFSVIETVMAPMAATDGDMLEHVASLLDMDGPIGRALAATATESSVRLMLQKCNYIDRAGDVIIDPLPKYEDADTRVVVLTDFLCKNSAQAAVKSQKQMKV